LDYIQFYANDTNRQALGALRNPSVKDFKYDWGINDINAPVARGELEG